MPIVSLDVRTLEPCEPLQQITAALTHLHPGELLRVTHRQEPHLLYPTLQQLGMSWQSRRLGPQCVEITIWHTHSQAAAKLASQPPV